MALRKSDIPTPALVVDLDVFDTNLARMQSTMKDAAKRLRPHGKAHKCPEIARRQIAAGAVGVCCATVAEMELFCEFDRLLTTPIASVGKADQLCSLAKYGPVSVVVDHPAQVKMFAASASKAGIVLNVLVDLDIGDHRTGVPCDERAISLAWAVAAEPSLRFAGLQAYSVSGSHTEGFEARKAHSTAALGKAIAVQQELLQIGLDATMLTGGSTGTAAIDAQIPELREMQAGSYALMDVAYGKLGGVNFEPAMTVIATVISASHTDRVTVDAGFKAFATDRPFGPTPLGLPDARWQWAGDEHGFLLFEEGAARPSMGARIAFLAPHCDPTVNLYNKIHACRGEYVEAVWPVK